MNLFNHPFPNVLMKVSSKRENLEGLQRGLVYMKESGYYRKLEDSFRGDPHDGKCPISLEEYSNDVLKLGPLSESTPGIEIPIKDIQNATYGFNGDDKVPIYCCSMLSEIILEQIDVRTFRFRKEFIKEMRQFGEYVALFYLHEMIEGLNSLIEEYGILPQYAPVEYVDISSEYNLGMLNLKRRDKYAPFFKKDFSYRWQNEWRLILISKQHKLIGENEDHYCLQLPPFEWFYIITIDELEKNNLEIF